VIIINDLINLTCYKLTCKDHLDRNEANEQYSSDPIVSVPQRILWCNSSMELFWQPVAILQMFQRDKQRKEFLCCTANFGCHIAAMTVGLSDEGVSIGRWPLIKRIVFSGSFSIIWRTKGRAKCYSGSSRFG
jgi:hypothetical protein